MVRASVLCSLVRRVSLTVLTTCLLYSPLIRAEPTASPSESPTPTTVPTPVALSGPALQVAVVGLRNAHGQVSCNLFTDPQQYPRGAAYKEVRTSIHQDGALCVFTGVPAGKYAIVVYHDENDNGHFDQNAFGMPAFFKVRLAQIGDLILLSTINRRLLMGLCQIS